jgi:putative ABC transport system permease protein
MFINDLKDTIRGLARAKGLTFFLLVSLALGTGANAALYGVVDALLFRGPAGVADASGLVDVYTSQLNGMPYGHFSYPDYLSLKAANTSLVTVAAMDDAMETVRVGLLAQRVRVARVSEEFFPALGLSAHVGRLLDADDAVETPGGAVISFALWDLLGRGDGIAGNALRVNERDYPIVGIAPPGFRGLHVGSTCDVWIPLDASIAAGDRGDRRLSVIARLDPGGRLELVQPALDRLASSLAAQYRDTNRGTLTSPEDPRRMTAIAYSRVDPGAKGQASAIGAIILGATTLLLVSACINAGSLLLSRSVARRRELAVKLALGASRGQLVRQCLTEGLLISLAGGALGLLCAFWTAGAIPALFAPEHAEMLDTSLNARIVMLTIAVSCVAGALFSVAPALHAMKSAPIDALRADAGGVSDANGRTWLRGALVVAQVGLSTVLVIATSLLVQGLAQALRGDFAFAARNVGIVVVNTPGGTADPARGLAYQAEVVGQLRTVQGVAVAGWVGTLPLGKTNRRELRIEAGRPEVTETVELDTNVVSTGYFQVMGIPLVEGRFFDEGDTGLAPPVVIVNELFAARYFAGPVAGHRLRDSQGAALTIVGVVASGKYRTLQDAPEPLVYYPLAQDYASYLHLIVRTSRDPATVIPRVRELLREVDRAAGVVRSSTLESHLSQALAVEKMTTTLVAVCGLIALILAAIGVYAVMADAVQRRTREIGLRIALGARWTQILRLVFGGALTLTLSGVLVGSCASILLARTMQTAVYGLPPVDAFTLTAVPAALAVVVIAAAMMPTRRALRVSPTIALRVD